MVVFAFSGVCFVQFMVTRADQIDVLFLGNFVGELSSRLGGVIDGVAFDAISSVDDKEV